MKKSWLNQYGNDIFQGKSWLNQWKSMDQICSLDAQIKVFKVRRQFVFRHIMPTQKMRRNQDLRSLATVPDSEKDAFLVEVSAVDFFFLKKNQEFQPQQFFHPENVKKGNEGMDLLRCVSPVVTLVTSSVANSAFWNPKCPSEKDSFQREAPFQRINPNHQTTTGCTS